jgi:hypothetical protein
MRSLRRMGIAIGILVVACPYLYAADNPRATQEREYPFPLALVETALRQMGAYTGARLPALEGFIKTERAQLPKYERPYYEFKIELVPAATDHTLVRVKANLSAWYSDPEGRQSGYQAYESNGRLESDLLDRLGDFLTNNKSTIATDQEQLARRLAAVRQQRLDAERRIADLEKQLQAPRPKIEQADPVEFVSVAKSRVPLLSAPEDRAPQILRAQFEDEFEVLEHRGTWLRVKLDDARTGWIRASQVRSNPPVVADSSTSPSEAQAGMEGFTIIRQTDATFSGDWSRLHGKRALYVWARPEGSALNTVATKKLRFTQAIFRERSREASHNSQSSVEGIVVIFLDQKGGVAAASLDDIGLWTDGSLATPAFLKKCSFDPPSAFGSPQALPNTAHTDNRDDISKPGKK